MMAVFSFILYFFCFFLIWKAAEAVVAAVVRISHRLNISSFAVSFFILGILTSIPELSIGINSLIDKDPQIFVGNLLGASFVLFVLVIPILAIFGNGIKLAHQLNEKNLIFSLFVVATPAIFMIDGSFNRKEGLFMVLIYSLLFYFIEKRKGFLEKIHDRLFDGKREGLVDLVKIVGGSLVIFFSSRVLVGRTLYFAEVFNISPFLISLLVLSVGTNLPELSVAMGSLIKKHKEVAFGDYIGSAVANTLLFGFLILVNGSFTIPSNNFLATLLLFAFGLVLFYFFSRSKKDISREEGLILLLVYFLFVVIEILFK
jgi:cation:H+ antiporter